MFASISRWMGEPLARAWELTATTTHALGDKLGDLERVARFQAGRLRFRPRADDLWVVTYPRSGTTWTLYALHLLLGRSTAFEHLEDVCPWFERSLAIGFRTADAWEALPSPRIFKSHLLPDWVPADGRFVYVRRDPVDVARSYHALYRDYLGFRGGFEAFAQRFERGTLQYGAWTRHVRAWQRHGVVALEYEDARRDPERALAQLAEALGLVVDPDGVTAAARGASIEAMRAEQHKFDHATALLRERGIARGSFIRTGQTSDSRVELELRERLRAQLEAPPPRAPLHAFLH